MASDSRFGGRGAVDIRLLAAIGAALLLVAGVMWVVPTTPDSNNFKFSSARRNMSDARPIEIGAQTEGRIVDATDADFYRITPLQSSYRLDVRMKSGSPTMIPGLRIYDAAQNLIQDKAPDYQRRPGSEIEASFLAQSNTIYYVEVFTQRNTPGPYSLIVNRREP